MDEESHGSLAALPAGEQLTSEHMLKLMLISLQWKIQKEKGSSVSSVYNELVDVFDHQTQKLCTI